MSTTRASRARSGANMLVDTGAWYAVADRSDRHHQKARRFYLSEAGRGRLLTTDLIVAETWTLLSAHLGRSAARKFWTALRHTRVPILTLDPVDLEAAWRIAEAFADQRGAYDTIRAAFPALEVVEVPSSAVTLAEAIRTYLFNAQLLTLPDGSMALIVPEECRESRSVREGDGRAQALFRDGPAGTSLDQPARLDQLGRSGCQGLVAARNPTAQQFSLVGVERNAGGCFGQDFTGIQLLLGPDILGEDVQYGLQTKIGVLGGVRAHASPSMGEYSPSSLPMIC